MFKAFEKFLLWLNPFDARVKVEQYCDEIIKNEADERFNIKSNLIQQAVNNGYPSSCIELRGISIIPRRKLHESGYKMMYVIGYNSNYKPYIISKCCDSIEFSNIFSKIPFHSIQMDIEKSGIINLWSRTNKFSVEGSTSDIRLNVSKEVE